LQERRNKYV